MSRLAIITAGKRYRIGVTIDDGSNSRLLRVGPSLTHEQAETILHWLQASAFSDLTSLGEREAVTEINAYFKTKGR